jgi:hypothetical protein
MTTASSRSRAYSLAAALCLVTAAAGFVYAGLENWIIFSRFPRFWHPAQAIAVAAWALPLLAAAVAVRSRFLLPHVLARGVAWTLFLPGVPWVLHGALPVFRAAMNGHPIFYGTLFTQTASTLGTGLALLLDRPALHTERARAEFAPIAARRALLAGAVGLVWAGFDRAFDYVRFPQHLGAGGVAQVTLGVASIAAAVGLVRMRTWGLLLGAAVSLAFAADAVFGPMRLGVPPLLYAMPGAFTCAVVFALRCRRSQLATDVRSTGSHAGSETEDRSGFEPAHGCCSPLPECDTPPPTEMHARS